MFPTLGIHCKILIEARTLFSLQTIQISTEVFNALTCHLDVSVSLLIRNTCCHLSLPYFKVLAVVQWILWHIPSSDVRGTVQLCCCCCYCCCCCCVIDRNLRATALLTADQLTKPETLQKNWSVANIVLNIRRYLN